ncbi:MAG: MmcQ/YjbR family DNA-binding protein [Solobacterium sp.]|nr:MmcQ/YjbR family DNA-binding protein [Solobacterium sp.]
MSLESECFRKKTINPQKLEAYGFTKQNGEYLISVPFFEGQFSAEIAVGADHQVRGRAIEHETGDEFIPLHVPMQTSAFVSSVRNAYIEVLKDIAEKCCDSTEFASPQANRIAAMILEKYGDSPERTFDDDDIAVFRNPVNSKWYGLIMLIERKKIQKDREGTVEIINLKMDTDVIVRLIEQQGIYPAYHMNHKHWISVVLDDTLSDDRIMTFIGESHRLTAKGTKSADTENHFWVIPSNPKYYSVKRAFARTKTISWHQDACIQTGDTVYIYITAPVSAIVYRTRVTGSNLPVPDKSWGKYKTRMDLRLEKIYPEELLRRNVLAEYGLGSVRGTRRIPAELQKVIEKLEDIE